MLKSSCCLILAASQLIGAICLDVELLLGVGDQLPVVCVSLSGATARFQHVSYVLQAVRVASATVLEMRIVRVVAGEAVGCVYVSVHLGYHGLLARFHRSFFRWIDRGAEEMVPLLLDHDLRLLPGIH